MDPKQKIYKPIFLSNTEEGVTLLKLGSGHPLPVRPNPPSLIMQRRKSRKEYYKWRDILLERDKGCIVCGETHLVNAHHLLPDCVLYREFQFDPSNGVMLCPTHHIWGIMSAHKNPFWFRMWMKKHRLGTLQLAEDRIEDLDEI